MAISGGDGSIILTTKVDQKGLKSGLKSMTSLVTKSFAVISAAAATATVAITKMAVSAYADYEQLVGGVETLFKGSAQKVIDYANDAFYTAGVSANEYMQQVTSFSASLIRSTAGDTDKAADIANMALIDISDNVNKMGSSMESVTLAYQGFAKQQYMLLDNLKLGYGGTKTEMERLLRDAQALTGVKYDINNLADVYSAIHAIQEELGITGTTAKEAEKTITGSANMMKAAWQNVLSAIAGGGDLDRAINNLVYSIQKYFENIVPVVERSLVGIGRLIEQVAPMLVQNVASALIQSIPSLINAIYQMIVGLAKGIWQGIKALFTGGSGSVTADIKTSVGGIATEAGNASTGMEELGDATEKAGKQAKKSLAAFDDLNIISSGAGGGAGKTPEIATGGIGGGGIDVDTSALAETENEVGGFASVMQEQFAKIAEIAKTVWDSTPVQTFVEATKTTLGTLWNFATTMWGDIKNNTLMTWQNIQGDLQTIGGNLVALWTSYWSDFNDAVKTWGQPIINSISKLFNSIWSTAIDPAVKLITKAWADFTGILLDLWNEHGKPLLNNIGEFVNNIIGLFQTIYDNVLEPIITPFLETLSWLWEEHLSKLVYAVGDFIMSLVNGALEIYNKFIDPIVKWLIKWLAPGFVNTFNTIVGVISSVVATIVDVATAIITQFTGIIDFITGVFTGNWKKAWDGVTKVFKGILDAWKGLFKGVINVIIDMINGLTGGWSAMAKSVSNIPGFSWAEKLVIPKIPKLAQGAVIPPNREFLAVLGDQKHGTNIEAPLQTIVDAFNIALQGNANYGGGNTEVVLEIDGREFGRAVVEQGNRENRRIGTRLVIA